MEDIMKVTQDIAILGGKRTAMAEYCGSGPEYGKFKDLSANDLGGHAIRASLADANLKPAQVGHVVMGNAMQTSVDAHYGARHAALKAGLPIETPALTVNRICGSGAQAVVNASQMLLLGEHDLAVAGGMENMSQAPFFIPGQVARTGIRFGQQPVLTDYLFQGLHDPFCNFFMAQTADNAAKKYDVTRDAADKFALRSHQLGAKAASAGRFKGEIAPVKVKVGRNEVVVETDDHIRPETTAEALAKLRPAFGEGGLVTAGNASGIVDGACALVLANAGGLKACGGKARAFVRGWSIAGVDPALMSLGPVPSIAGVLRDTGLTMKDVDLVEINEAFAPQVVACVNALKQDHNIELPLEKLNVNGGAVSLGHPLGATGARLILTLVHELEARRGRYGIASMCIGGGQGIAVLIERA